MYEIWICAGQLYCNTLPRSRSPEAESKHETGPEGGGEGQRGTHMGYINAVVPVSNHVIDWSARLGASLTRIRDSFINTSFENSDLKNSFSLNPVTKI